jgi:hypothetical protein
MRTQLLTWAAAVTLIASVPGLAVALDPAGAAGGALGGAAEGVGGAAGGAADSVGGALGGAAGTAGGGGAAERGADRAGAAADRAVNDAGQGVGNAAGAIGGAAGSLTGGGADVGRGIGSAVRDEGGNLGNAVGAIGGNTGGSSDPARGGAAAGASGGGGTAARGRNASEPAPGPGPAAVTGTVPTARAEVPSVQDIPVIIRLPLVLIPDRSRSGTEAERVVPGLGTVRGPERVLRQLPRPLSRVPGVARRSVDSCRETIAAEAKPHGAVRVEAVSAGAPTRARQGITRAPIEARIIYARGGRVQVRQARITCQLNAQGRVISLG